MTAYSPIVFSNTLIMAGGNVISCVSHDLMRRQPVLLYRIVLRPLSLA